MTTRSTTVRLPEHVFELLRAESEARGWSLTETIADAIRFWLEANDAEASFIRERRMSMPTEGIPHDELMPEEPPAWLRA